MARSKAEAPDFGSVQEAAEHISKFLETRKRGDKKFVTFNDSAPQWMVDIAHEAHGDMMPNDHKYEFISEAIDRFSEEEDPDRAMEDIEPDIYTGELLEWVASHGERPGYVDEAVAEFGHSDQGVVGDIGMGQYMEKTEVYGSIRNSLENLVVEQ